MNDYRKLVEEYGRSSTALPASVESVEAPAQHEPGAKLDQDKVDLSLLLLFTRALRELSRVGQYGAEKYTRGGFLSVPEGERRYTAALLRHLFAESEGETHDTDPYLQGTKWEDSIRHDAQVAWNALARLEVRLRKEEENGTG